MAKRKQFSLEPVEHPRDAGNEIERLFDAELRAANRPVLRDLPVDRIQPNPFQARQNFEHLDGLVNSIRSQGFVSRLRVRPHPDLSDTFQLVYGERRLRAATEAGLSTVPVEIASHSDDQLIEIGLAENIQRQDLDPLEEAYAFKTFITQRGYTQQRLAERIGKDVSYIEERLHVLEDTPLDVQDMVRQRNDTLRSAREIAKVPDEEVRATLIAGVLEHRLSTRAVRERVRDHLEGAGKIASQLDQARQASTLSPAVETLRQSKTRTPSLTTTTTVDELNSSTVDIGFTIDRDIRNVRSIFVRWQRHIETLEEPYLSRLISFMTDEHLRQVEEVIRSLEEKR